jgi:hypothetical protein
MLLATHGSARAEPVEASFTASQEPKDCPDLVEGIKGQEG